MNQPIVLSKLAIANFRRVSRTKYEQQLISEEHRRSEVNALVSGYDDGMRAMLQHLLDDKVVVWAPE